MTPTTGLETLEQRTYTGRHDDGLLDLAVGVGLAAVGAAWLTDTAWAGAIAPVLLVPIWSRLRATITAPRAGTFRSREPRRALERRKYTGLMLLGVAVLSIGVAVYLRRPDGVQGDLAASIVPALPGVLLAVGAVLTALIFGLRRFLIYAMVLVVAAGAAVERGLEPGLYIAEVGIFIAVVGAVMLVGFVRHNPLPDLGDHA